MVEAASQGRGSVGLSALEGGIHWHQLASAAYDAFKLPDFAEYKDLGEHGQQVWKRVAMSVASAFCGKINGNLVCFDGKEVIYKDPRTLKVVG